MKRFFVFLVFGFIWAGPAHAALFYEFNPDYAQSLLVASSETVSEVFLPLNDYLGALDFWVSNGSAAGDATFTLYNAAGTVVAERTVTVPAIADTAGGTRLRVTLPAQIAVNGNTAYRVRITTGVPTFRLYYADATQLLAHNGVPLPAYTGGLARIGSDDMGFSFKFALYENSESTPPQLTGVSVSLQSSTQVVVSFHANEPVDRQLLYGASTVAFNGEYSSCAPNVQTCTALLAVTPATTYSYTLTVKDVWGNQSSATGTFTSLDEGQPTPTLTPTPTVSTSATPTPTASPTPTPDTSVPILSNVRVASSTPHSAALAWTTSEAANSIVVVQILPYLITAGANNDSTFELEHLVHVGNLPSDTFLRATITSSDAVGNSAKTTIDFMTPQETIAPTATPSTSPGATPTATPAPAPSVTPTVSGPTDNPEISWSTPAGGSPTDGYRIDVFDAANNLVKTVTVPPDRLRVALGTLPAGDNRVVIYANNGGVFEKVAAPTPVTTRPPRGFLERAVVSLPYILGGIVALILVGLVVMKLRKPKQPAPPPSGTSEMKAGAIPNPPVL